MIALLTAPWSPRPQQIVDAVTRPLEPGRIRLRWCRVEFGDVGSLTVSGLLVLDSCDLILGPADGGDLLIDAAPGVNIDLFGVTVTLRWLAAEAARQVLRCSRQNL